MENREKVVKKFVKDVIDDMVKYVKKRGWVYEGWYPVVFLATHKRYERPYGGMSFKMKKPYMFLPLNYFLDTDKCPIKNFEEYEHIHSDKEIGSIEYGYWKDVLIAIIAHEMAHAVDFTMDVELPKIAYKKYIPITKREELGHEVAFQYYYRALRRNFIGKY